MKRALKKTEPSSIEKSFPGLYDVALRFDFFNGLINKVEIPYPPLNPILQLEDVFLDSNDDLVFGGIIFPEELEPEISQTPL